MKYKYTILKIIGILFLPLMLMAAGDQEVKWKAIKGKKSANCSGNGVCIVKESNYVASDFTFATNDMGELSFRINKAELSTNQPEAYAELEGSTEYLIEEPVELPTELAQALELGDEYTIAVGTYPMHDNGEEFVVSITDDGTTMR